MSGTGTSGAEDNIQPGTPETDGKGLAYQIRSADQLQFINWSYVDGTGSATRLVTKNNYKLFPYLQYTNSTGTAKQTRTDAERNRLRAGSRPMTSTARTKKRGRPKSRKTTGSSIPLPAP